jgi:hypothetical protein
MEVDVGMIGFALVGIIAKLTMLTCWSFIHTSTSLTHSQSQTQIQKIPNLITTQSPMQSAICNLYIMHHYRICILKYESTLPLAPVVFCTIRSIYASKSEKQKARGSLQFFLIGYHR